MRIFGISLILGGLFVSTGGLASPPLAASGSGSADRLLLPPTAKVGDETFGELTARWWRWAEHMPIAPYLDPDGRLCEFYQDGPVWFLAGTDGSFNARRRCVVPKERHILVPVINMLHSSVVRRNGSPPTTPCNVLQGRAAVNNDRLGSAVVLIDGMRVSDVARYRVRSDGCFQLEPGSDASLISAADGYWLLIEPLPAGRHTLVVGANYAADEAGYGRMVQNFEYVLDVGGKTDEL